MSEPGHTDIHHHIKTYVAVFIGLMVLTILTVSVSYLHLLEIELAVSVAVGVAMVIAAVKGSLVAAYFMHLKSELPAIYWILMLTAVFWAFVMFMPVLSFLDATHLR